MSEESAKKDVQVEQAIDAKVTPQFTLVRTEMKTYFEELSKEIKAIAKPVPANDTASKATHEIGFTETTGEHKGEIYGGIFPDGKPGWILEEPEPMTHYAAAALGGRALPTSKEGKYIDTIKGKGALNGIFARHSNGSSFWLAERDNFGARYQQFSDGLQGHSSVNGNLDYYRLGHLPVLCVVR
jgi:hypothetical protein